MNENDNIDQDTVKAVLDIVQTVVSSFATTVNQKIEEVEERLERYEKQLATLIVGYGEQAVFMEALVAQLAFATDEQRKTFNESLNDARHKMLGVMKDAAAVNLASEDPDLATAVENLASEKLSDSDI